jgi:hypothetical protein
MKKKSKSELETSNRVWEKLLNNESVDLVLDFPSGAKETISLKAGSPMVLHLLRMRELEEPLGKKKAPPLDRQKGGQTCHWEIYLSTLERLLALGADFLFTNRISRSHPTMPAALAIVSSEIPV